MSSINKILTYIPELKELGEVQQLEFTNELNSLIESLNDLLSLREKYETILLKEAELSKKVEELKNRIFPSIYFGTAKHHTTKEPYIIARSMWKKGLNDYSQLSAYIGPVAKFPKGVNDPEVKKIALDKIRKKIQKSFPME